MDEARFPYHPLRTGQGRLVDWSSSGNGIFYQTGLSAGEYSDYAGRLSDFATDWPNDTKADTMAAVNFTDEANQDYTLLDSSPFKYAADDGKDCGVDFVELNAAIAGVE